MVKNKIHTILNEKYRPDTLEGYICNEEVKIKFKEYIDKQDIPHLLFEGKAGSGKTTLAKILVSNIDCDFLYINATDERGMEVMREKVGSFASAGSFKPLKIVILDEATHLLQASQVILLNMIETYSLTTRFILTGNYVERLIEPLRSRLQEYNLIPPSKKVVAQHIDFILEKEEIEHTVEDVVLLVKQFYPDLRKIINNAQKYTVDGVLKLDKSISSVDDYKEKLLTELNTSHPLKGISLNNIRQILADSKLQDFEEIFRFLYDNLDKYSKGNDGVIICLIEEYAYHAITRLDKEINIVALMSKIVQILNKKQVI